MLESWVGFGLDQMLADAGEEVGLPFIAMCTLEHVVECFDVVTVWARLVSVFRDFESGVCW